MKMILIVKIHRYWHFMSDNDTIWILYIYVNIPLCKSSHFQCDAEGKATVTYTADESTQQQNNHIFTCTAFYTKLIYIHTDDFIFTVFKINKKYNWSIYQNSAWESEHSLA